MLQLLLQQQLSLLSQLLLLISYYVATVTNYRVLIFPKSLTREPRSVRAHSSETSEQFQQTDATRCAGSAAYGVRVRPLPILRQSAAGVRAQKCQA